MNVLADNAGDILEGFWKTIQLFAISGVASLILGVLLASMRVCPVPVLRGMGTAYVHVARNTPLVLIFIIFVFGFPTIGIQFSFFTFAVMALTAYTSAFICESVRSGINAVSAGQAEAARALGMTFRQNLTLIVLPQAGRSAIPPITNILIALVRNTAVAEAFGVTEASYVMSGLLRDHADQLYWIFIGIAGGYMVIVFTLTALSALLERKLAVLR
ncbi:amino acid ABC transporter permease [Sporichthya sp.]|uniref:amino acid ABC transporter permease n=1 Tax=Sporichthya sp. TaxID=65475 RepID=UPI0017C73470|nr:amino acid ABC transporter permease [Sporichthya sp.]MBA3742420.1 amino acid ABC transporter permease [Sporichthya sp.]